MNEDDVRENLEILKGKYISDLDTEDYKVPIALCREEVGGGNLVFYLDEHDGREPRTIVISAKQDDLISKYLLILDNVSQEEKDAYVIKAYNSLKDTFVFPELQSIITTAIDQSIQDSFYELARISLDEIMEVTSSFNSDKKEAIELINNINTDFYNSISLEVSGIYAHIIYEILMRKGIAFIDNSPKSMMHFMSDSPSSWEDKKLLVNYYVNMFPELSKVDLKETNTFGYNYLNYSLVSFNNYKVPIDEVDDIYDDDIGEEEVNEIFNKIEEYRRQNS